MKTVYFIQEMQTKIIIIHHFNLEAINKLCTALNSAEPHREYQVWESEVLGD